MPFIFLIVDIHCLPCFQPICSLPSVGDKGSITNCTKAFASNWRYARFHQNFDACYSLKLVLRSPKNQVMMRSLIITKIVTTVFRIISDITIRCSKPIRICTTISNLKSIAHLLGNEIILKLPNHINMHVTLTVKRAKRSFFNQLWYGLE